MKEGFVASKLCFFRLIILYLFLKPLSVFSYGILDFNRVKRFFCLTSAIIANKTECSIEED